MKRKLSTILLVLLMVIFSTTPVYAGFIKLNGSPGASNPLHLFGDMTGLGGYTQGVVVTLRGAGDVLSVTCLSPGSQNPAPGQNPGKITVTGSQNIGDEDITKKGTADVEVYATNYEISIDVCPNSNWWADYDIDWQEAWVLVTDKATGELLLDNHYFCAPDDNNPGHYACTLDTSDNTSNPGHK